MKQLFILSALILNLLIVHPAVSSEISEGREAYESGDYFTAMEKLYPLAEQGSAEAQFILGVMYRKGLGIGKDGTAALKWTTDAAQGGHAEAQYYLGLIYQTGFGIGKDLGKARNWYQLATDQGHNKARKSLSRMSPELAQGRSKLKGQDQKVARVSNPNPKPESKPVDIPVYNQDKPANKNEASVPSYQKGLRAFDQGDYVAARTEWQPLAEQGDPEAQYQLASLYYEGQGVKSNFLTAGEWYKLAAEKGHAGAQHKLGTMYFSGAGFGTNLKAAEMWLKRSMEQGYAPGQYMLGYFYSNSGFIFVDRKEIYRLVRLAADQGLADAQVYLGLMSEVDAFTDKEKIKLAVKWYSLAADQGDQTGQSLLGVFYKEGRKVAKNYQKALDLFYKSAVQGNRQAQRNVGEMHEEGLGVPVDIAEARKWYRRSAAQGYSTAERSLEHLNKKYPPDSKTENPDHDKRDLKVQKALVNGDYESALVDLIPLIEEGHVNSQYTLGLMNLMGKGMPKSYLKAVPYLTVAAEQGHLKAQSLLGIIYGNENSGLLDHDKAVKWYKLAAEQGDAGAQASLGLAYNWGRGVLEDNNRAYMWLSLAAQQGDKTAENNQNSLEEYLTAAQLATAQKLARQCIAQKYQGC